MPLLDGVRPEALHSFVVVFVAVVALLLAAALPAIVVTEWTRPRRVSQATRTVRTVAAVPMVALPMLWACVGFVFLLSPECFVVPAFGEDVLWVQDHELSPPRSVGAGATWTSCPGSPIPRDTSHQRLLPGALRSQPCGPLTFQVFDSGDGAAVERQWSRPGWSCLSSDARGGYGRRELGLWTSLDRSRITYGCRALEPDLSAHGSPFVTQGQLALRALHEPRGPGENRPPLVVAFFVASLAFAAGAVAWLHRADRRSRSRLSASEAPSTDDAPGDEGDEAEVGATPFRSSRLVRPALPPQRSPRRAAFERGVRWRWCVAAAVFAAALTGSLALITHHGHVPGRPLVTTRSFDLPW